MRCILSASALAAALALTGSCANAQSQPPYQHHSYCLKTASSQECAYDSLPECEAAKRGNADICMQNTAPVNH